MKTNITYTWKFYTCSVEGKNICKECGKTVRKQFSTEYREDSTPDKTSMLQRKEEWEKQEVICNKCLKSRLKSDRKEVKVDTSSIKNLLTDFTMLKQEINNECAKIRDNVSGTVVILNGVEYVVDNVNTYDSLLFFELDKISNYEPWLCTNNCLTFRYDFNNCKEENIIFTDEVFSKRKEQIAT